MRRQAGDAWQLSWGIEEDEERRLLLTQMLVMTPMLLLAVALPLLPLFEQAVQEEPVSEPPPRLARLLVQKPPPPPPPPSLPKAEAVAPKPTPAPRVAASPTPPKPAARQQPRPAPPQPSARERAADALRGVDATLSSFRQQDITSQIETERKLSGATGAEQDNAGAVIAADLTQGSGGIGEDRVVAPTGNTQLAGRQTTAVAGSSPGTAAGGQRNRAGSYSPERSSESIQLVIDRNKNAFDRLYARALRTTPDISGTVVLRFTIAPDGSVTRCEIVSSELGDAELERKLVARFRLLDFGNQSVPAITVDKPMTFYPR